MLQNPSQFSDRADIWALGVLMLFVCNRGQYVDTSVLSRGELSARHIQGSHSSDLLRILQRMVSISPHGRPSAGEILSECTPDRMDQAVTIPVNVATLHIGPMWVLGEVASVTFSH